MMNRKERLNLAEWAVEYVQKCGADQVGITITNNRIIEISLRDKKLEKIKESIRNKISLGLYVKHRYSSHTTNDFRKNSLEQFIKEAVESTKYLARDKYRSLPEPEYYPKKLDINLQIYDPSQKEINPEERVKIVKEIETSAISESNKIISVTSGYTDSNFHEIKIHSNGFSGEQESTFFSSGAVVTVKDKDKGRPADWFYASTRFFKDLPSPQMLGKNAVHRALQKIGQKKIESGKYDMIVENRVSSRFINMLRTAMTGASLQQKRSFLEGMLDKKIASEKFTMIDDPLIKKGFGSRLYDSEGLALKRRVMIEKGVIRQYYIDNYYGKKLGITPSSGSISNVICEYGKKSMEEMIKDIKKGILINQFIGGNSNSTTGDFSYGIAGLLIKNGEIVHPVNEMSISGNVIEFWNRLKEMGNDPYPYSYWATPSMFFKGVQFSGI